MASRAMHVFTVQEFVGAIKTLLQEEPLFQDAWVRGELSNVSRAASGHTYFTLKDEAGQLRCVLFRGRTRALGVLPENGLQVLVHGQVSLYEAQGNLQFYVDAVEPDGVGLEALELEALKRRLQAEGLFDESRKRALPRLPACIGVVTSAHGAVWHDIQTVIARRFPATTLVLAPAQVQGATAAPSLVTALQLLWKLGTCDVIIVGRGGGSAEDLAVFNDETLARAIFASPVPVVSAVGHEVDFTIADLVADRRAPTPSAAAELLVPDQAQLRSALYTDRTRLRQAVSVVIGQVRGDLQAVELALRRVSPTVSNREQRLRLDSLAENARHAVRSALERERGRVYGLGLQVRALDPAGVLARGYAVVTDASSGHLIASTAEATAGRRLNVHVRDGRFGARVEGTHE